MASDSHTALSASFPVHSSRSNFILSIFPAGEFKDFEMLTGFILLLLMRELVAFSRIETSSYRDYWIGIDHVGSRSCNGLKIVMHKVMYSFLIFF